MTPLRPVAITAGAGSLSPQLFQSLATSARAGAAQRTGATFAASAALHSTLAAALVLLPLLLGNALPGVGPTVIDEGPILDIQVLPPPPAGSGPQNLKARPRPQPRQAAVFAAPITVPQGVQPDKDTFDFDGRPDGVPGGVPDLPAESKYVGVVNVPDATDKTTKTTPGPVRTGGLIAPPQLVRRVEPRYPELAQASRVSALVVLEAEVDAFGRVQAVRVLSGHPLFDQASIDAVKQWRYQPLLLNGEPTAFIVTVNLVFRLQNR